MDIEFHYYITYLLAARAGFSDDDAFLLAYASQQTDDNCKIITISKGTDDTYSNYISQTSNIMKPEKQLMQIYPVFHFMPGSKEEIEWDEACRRDGKYHVLNTIPDNSNAKLLFTAALTTGNLYRIGIATHMYADTFAHQNFVGYYESFNSMKDLLDKALPDVGHAEAKHDPDLVGLEWKDARLTRKFADIRNKDRFLKAAGKIFEAYLLLKQPLLTESEVAAKKTAILGELETAIGGTGDHGVDGARRSSRVQAYIDAINKHNKFRPYDEHAWLDAAADRKGPLSVVRAWADYEWKPNYQQSHWYLFQEAVKNHQWDAKEKVLDKITANLELDRFNN